MRTEPSRAGGSGWRKVSEEFLRDRQIERREQVQAMLETAGWAVAIESLKGRMTDIALQVVKGRNRDEEKLRDLQAQYAVLESLVTSPRDFLIYERREAQL